VSPYIQTDGIAGVVFGTIFSFAILAVLVIVYDLNNLNWGSEQINVHIASNAFMRSWIGGCVEKRLLIHSPRLNGFEM